MEFKADKMSVERFIAPNVTLYEALGLAADAGVEEIKARTNLLRTVTSVKYSVQIAHRADEVKAHLFNKKKRKAYDQVLATAVQSALHGDLINFLDIMANNDGVLDYDEEKNFYQFGSMKGVPHAELKVILEKYVKDNNVPRGPAPKPTQKSKSKSKPAPKPSPPPSSPPTPPSSQAPSSDPQRGAMEKRIRRSVSAAIGSKSGKWCIAGIVAIVLSTVMIRNMNQRMADTSDYQTAIEQNTFSSFRDYLIRHREGKYKKPAIAGLRAMDKEDFALAQQENTISAYVDYYCDHTYWGDLNGQFLTQVERTLSHPRNILGRDYSIGAISLAFSPDGKLLASNSKIWDVTMRKKIHNLGSYSNAVAFCPKGQLLAFGLKKIKFWDIANGKGITTLKGQSAPPGEIDSMAFSPNGQLLACGYDSGALELWNVENHNLIKKLAHGVRNGKSITTIAFSPDGTLLASGSGKVIELWDMESLGHKESVEQVDRATIWSLSSVAFSPDGRVLFSGWGDGKIRQWSIKHREQLRTMQGASREVYSIAFSGDGELFACASYDNVVTVWRGPPFFEKVHFTVARKDNLNFNATRSVAFHPNGGIAVGDLKGNIFLWPVANDGHARCETHPEVDAEDDIDAKHVNIVNIQG